MSEKLSAQITQKIFFIFTIIFVSSTFQNKVIPMVFSIPYSYDAVWQWGHGWASPVYREEAGEQPSNVWWASPMSNHWQFTYVCLLYSFRKEADTEWHSAMCACLCVTDACVSVWELKIKRKVMLKSKKWEINIPVRYRKSAPWLLISPMHKGVLHWCWKLGLRRKHCHGVITTCQDHPDTCQYPPSPKSGPSYVVHGPGTALSCSAPGPGRKPASALEPGPANWYSSSSPSSCHRPAPCHIH